MENWIKRIFLNDGRRPVASAVLACAMASVGAGQVMAEEVDAESETAVKPLIEPEVTPRRVQEDLIDTEDFEVGVYTGLMSVEDFGVNFVIGARLAYHINEDLFVEANYGVTDTSETSYEKLSGSAKLLKDDERDLTYYNLSLGYNIFPGEIFFGSKYAFNTNFYVVGGLGSTQFAGDDRLTANFGWGFQMLGTDWLSLHLGMRDHIFDTDILGEDKKTHNLEMTTGLSVFF
ncbi:outer membrane beta-barrel domain-containing protein [Hahella aquimaris]|uniref:outer membrane beta-barrel domain-containing protein n=1 Tax=Hahella sp. HNIBRBA332 TaxID=3015983 RepID=UPI00273BF6EF|nr:outer membrane beta-barrel domain-containing protein [Hahella sp. HNIBRBA332]WLQ16966.1 outer membrane beta-barrel domain-containing protein [Hahella sp. HNIBRBA332]